METVLAVVLIFWFLGSIGSAFSDMEDRIIELEDEKNEDDDYLYDY